MAENREASQQRQPVEVITSRLNWQHVEGWDCHSSVDDGFVAGDQVAVARELLAAPFAALAVIITRNQSSCCSSRLHGTNWWGFNVQLVSTAVPDDKQSACASNGHPFTSGSGAG